MKIALGTAQFGLDYGISNQQGKVNIPEVTNILEQALSLGIDTLDCAGAYGDSEAVLGKLGASKRFNLISKIPALSIEQNTITQFFEQSLNNLKSDSLDTMLFHQAENLIEHPNKLQLFTQLALLKKQKLIKKIGVSVYSPEQLKIIAESFPIDIVQVPVNIFDQRFLSPNVMQLCSDKKIKLHARSIFLQGLLFIEEEKLSPYFEPYKNKLKAFNALAKHLSCTKLTLALAIALLAKRLTYKTCKEEESSYCFEKLVIGVCSTKQLIEVVNAYEQVNQLRITNEELYSLADTRLGFINPSQWVV